MTRQDFIIIAAALRETFSEDARETAGMDPGTWGWLRHRAAMRMGDRLALQNPRFDFERFLAAVER